VVSFEATNNPGEGQKKANKRGRKKKEEVPIVEADDDVAIDDQGLEQSHISNSENISDTSSLEKIIEKPPQQKRGRKKKKSVLISEDDPINGLEEPQNDSVAIQNDIQVSSENKVKSKRTKKSKSRLIDVEIAATIEPVADLEQIEITPSIVENKKASKKRAKKRKNSSIEEESPAAPEEVEGGPSPRKRGRPSTTIPAPKKTENKRLYVRKPKLLDVNQNPKHHHR
jgi:hypothetical protein